MVATTTPSPPPTPAAAPYPAVPCPQSPVPSPLFAATLLLTTDLPFPDLAAKLQIPLEDLLDLLDSDDGASYLDTLVRLTNLRAAHKQAQSKITGLTILEDIAKTTEDPQERRRAATALVRSHWTYRPSPIAPSPPRAPQSKIPPPPNFPRPDPDPRPSPDAPPYSASPDTAVARDLATLKSLHNPEPETAFCALYHHLAVPAKTRGRCNEPFKQDLEKAGLLDLEGVELSQEPAVPGPPPDAASQPGYIPSVHGTETATVRVQLQHPGGRTSVCTFHIQGSPSGWKPDDPYPTRWATLRIEPHDTG